MSRNEHLEYRYYEMPAGSYIIPLLGEELIQEYGIEYTLDDLHFHNFLEIGYCYDGDGILKIEDYPHSYTGGCFSVIPQNIPHVTKSAPGKRCAWEFLFIDVIGFIEKEMNLGPIESKTMAGTINSRAFFLQTQDNESLNAIVCSLIRECREEGPWNQEALKGYIRCLLIEIVRLSIKEGSGHSYSASKLGDYIRKSLEYVDDHYFEDIGVVDMAKAVGLSQSHFRRIFESAMNMKPLDYLNLVRINNACRLMQDESLSMEEVGIRVGFGSQSTFNRNFKAVLGQSPLQWKKNGSGDDVLSNYNITALRGWSKTDIHRGEFRPKKGW